MQRHDNHLLLPVAWLYGAVVNLRNFLFNQRVLPQQAYPIPLICVGNITVGGTGKTPHVELLIELLSPSHRIAVISRGYRRRTHGLREVTLDSTVDEVGDEPKQMKHKFPEVRFIVDGNRRRAMAHLLALPEGERPEVVLLDDGFQHRYVRPSFSILLVDAQRELHTDRLLPVGDLREPATARYRADCIILTKCPEDMSPIQLRIMQRNLALYPHQRVFFSRISYAEPIALSAMCGGAEEQLPEGARVLAVSGIARPESFHSYLRGHYELVDAISYRDHHQFRPRDIEELRERYNELQQGKPDEPLYILTTEKDAVRLADHYDSLPEELRSALFYLPIRTQILYHPEQFAKMISTAACALPTALQR